MRKGSAIWIIDDDEDNRIGYRELLSISRPDDSIFDFECLSDAYQSNLVADFIFIDLSAVDGRTIPCFDNHSYIGNLQRFAEKHRSAFIVIMSALVSHAQEDMEDLKEACPDAAIFVIDPCDTKKPNAMAEFVSKYSS